MSRVKARMQRGTQGWGDGDCSRDRDVRAITGEVKPESRSHRHEEMWG